MSTEPVTERRTPEQPLAPRTTTQEDLTTQGQRRINLIWEITQACIAILITAAVVWCAINKIESVVLTNAFFLIVGFYFSRTNHAAIGGVGWKPSVPYEGR